MKDLIIIIQIFIISAFAVSLTCASDGDRTSFFVKCKDTCERANCTKDKQYIASHAIDFYHQNVFDRLLAWTCGDECTYSCMWRTVDSFVERGWKVPQFYGKWPFVRFLGLQEPASVIFSLMNLVTHIRQLQKFRERVRRDSPCYILWHLFGFLCVNGWVWSTVFHARDFPLTELMDYTSAYLMVLATFYVMVIRMIHNKSIVLKGLVSALVFSFYINYFAYLSVGKFSYSFNMTTNIVTGAMGGIGWITWCILVRKRRPYYKKMIQFYFLTALTMSLELIDFPPLFWAFDAHAIWHLSTVPLACLLYGFAIDDCRALHEEQMSKTAKYNKII